MFVIVAYDCHIKRGPKVKKVCRQYLHQHQNSVFAGELTQRLFQDLCQQLQNLLAEDYDKVTIFQAPFALESVDLGVATQAEYVI